MRGHPGGGSERDPLHSPDDAVGAGGSPDAATESADFIREMIQTDNASGKYGGRVATRFPPEPNGYLHIGHAKAICLNFGLAEDFDGATCNLRFDDTNPLKESTEFVDSIKEDIRWLGFDWGEREFYASDYFEKLYEGAVKLIREGKAYVDESTADEIRAMRGTLTSPGTPSPYRDRPAEESLALFEKMRNGELPDGAAVLRAKIDMAAPNVLMRDPPLYRVRHVHHHRTGDAWCIYPMYDFTHCLSDAFENITHSLCTLEFENNRPLYDWVLEAVETDARPEQTEYARLALEYTLLSKRKLRQLVEENWVDGWDDPRMPTISGLRRRGYTPQAIRAFCERIGVAKRNSLIDMTLLENAVRDDLNQRAQRRMAVLRPLKLVITSYPEDQVEEFDAVNNPENEADGTRRVPFSREVWIERTDFMEDAPKKYFRFSPGREVRLRYAYLVTCTDVVKNDAGEVVEIHGTHDPDSRGGNAPDGRRVRGTVHWVSARHAVPAEVRLYDRLFSVPNPDDAPEGKTFLDNLNPDSLEILDGARVEPALTEAKPGDPIQFERHGYFAFDPKFSSADRPVFNRAVSLRDSWAKIAKKLAEKG